MSASRRATSRPRRLRATARFTVTDDFPTPPLPLATARTRGVAAPGRFPGARRLPHAALAAGHGQDAGGGAGPVERDVGGVAAPPLGEGVAAAAAVVVGVAPAAGAQALAQALELLGAHHGELDGDLVDAGQRPHGRPPPRLDLGAHRAAGHGEGHGDRDVAAVDGDVPHHLQVDDASADLGVLHRPEGLDDLRFGDGHVSLHYRGVGRTPAVATPEDERAFSAEVAAITGALGDATRREAWLFARSTTSAGVTVADVADHLGLHPNVARHHLDKLAASTYLEVFTAKGEGRAAGRPAKRYRVPQDVREVGSAIGLPARRDDLLVTLLGRALALVPQPLAEAMAEQVGEEYGRGLAASMVGDATAVQRDVRAALHAVADALTAHGFAAHAEARGGSIAVIADHCPFGSTAAQHPVICAVDRGIVRGMLAGLGVDRQPAQESSR